MNLKTYLRGLGLGLIVAALVTGVGSGQPMSDEQVKARAKELGMIESKTYLTQVNESEEAMEDESLEEASTVEETQMQETDIAVPQTEESERESSEEKSSETVTEETRAETETLTEQETETEPEMATETEYVTFQVRSGDSSVSVAKRLAQVGLVGDAEAFDQYLCQNGYDKRIRVGSYEIAYDSSNEEIAKTITGDK